MRTTCYLPLVLVVVVVLLIIPVFLGSIFFGAIHYSAYELGVIVLSLPLVIAALIALRRYFHRSN